MDFEAQALPGLVWAFRFFVDGSSEELPIDQPIPDHEGRCGYISISPTLALATS